MLAPDGCLFSFKFMIAVAVGMMNDFLLFTEHFGYYVVRLWVLFYLCSF